MGSKKKRQVSESSSSSSGSSDSESPKRQNKKSRERKEEPEREDKERKRRRSPTPPPKEPQKKDEKRPRDDRAKYEDRRNRPNNYNRNYDDRYRNRRPDYRDRRDDRDRDHREQRDREYRDRERDYRSRRDDNRDRDRDRNRRRSRSQSFDHKNAKWGKNDDKKPEEKDNKDKQKPDFALSGKLTEERNTYRGVVIKYSEPPEARKPKRRWRLYPFKGDKALQTLYIHRESAYLIGRDRKVVDLPVDHPSCSKQHAVLQYRLVPFTRDDGTAGKRVRPYLIDLNSANGTHINNKKIEPSKYVELLEKDVIKFGFSSREYVLLHENSKDEAQDDDVKQEDEVVVKKEENENRE